MRKMDDAKKDNEGIKPVLNPLNWNKPATTEDGGSDMDRLSPSSTGDSAFGDAGSEVDKRVRSREKTGKTSAAAASSSGSGGPALPPHSTSGSPPASPAVSPELVSALIAALGKEVRKIVKEEIQKQHGDDDRQDARIASQSTPRASASAFIPPAPREDESGAPTGTTEEHVAATGPESFKTSLQESTEQQASVRFSEDVEFSGGSTSRTESRKHRGSSGSDVQLSTIDHAWGTLFDTNGGPTKRLEQILGGLAKYITESFMPGPTIVIGPDKLAAYYSYYAIDDEPLPLLKIFRARPKEISDLYLDLKIEYHLVQADPRSPPTIPALTAKGFTQWIIKNIQAYPEEEARRLEKVMSACPIEADSPLLGTPERLPKQLSRHLLPEKHDRKTRKLLDEAINDLMDDVGLSSAGPGSKPRLETSHASRDRRESMTSSRGPTTPVSPDWKHGDTHSSHDHHRRSSTARDSYSRGQGVPPPTLQTRAARASVGSNPHTSTSHLHIPPHSSGRNTGQSRSRSPQPRLYRASYPEVHNTAHRSSVLSSSSAAAAYVPSPTPLAPPFELPSVRERDNREKAEQNYRVYASPRESLSSLDDTPKAAGGSRGLDKGTNAPRRVTVGDLRADPGEAQDRYHSRDVTTPRGPTFADDD